MLFLRFMRRDTRNAMMPAATRARKPSTTMTAIAQPGNLFALSDCTEPVPDVELAVGAPPEVFEDAPEPFPPLTPETAVDVAVTDLDADALDDAADAEDAEAAEADDMEATT